MCDYSVAHIVVKGRITAEGDNPINRKSKKLAFKNIVPFISSISKINCTFLESAEDLDIDMSMYKLLDYSEQFFITSGSL